jgi:hypothetical protein
MRLDYGSGKARITLSGTQAASVESLLRALVPETTARLEQAAEDLWRNAHNKWPTPQTAPRSTGYSKGQLDWGIRIERGGNAIVGFVVCDADYAIYIKSVVTGGKATAQELILTPGKDATTVARIASDVAASLKRAAEAV